MSLEITPKTAFETLKKNTLESINNYFPYEGRKQKVVVENLRIDDNISHDDIREQAKVRDNEGTWGVPIKATIKLIDKATGKVVDEKKNAVLGRLPKLTNRYGFLVNGNEYQVDHLLRLKSGVYARVQANGDLESEFNLEKSPLKGAGFSVKLDNKSKAFTVKIHGTNVPLYPVMKAMGVSDDQMEKEWGKQVFAANKTATEEKFKNSLHKFWAKTSEEGATPPASLNDYADHVVKFFEQSHLLPETTAITLGKPFTHVTGDALARASTKILGVAANTHKPDDRDSLAFKKIVGVEDFIPEKISNSKMSIKARLRNTVDHKKSISDIITTDLFNRPIHEFFTKGGSLAERSDQTNPIQMLSAHRKTTIMSKDFGGIKNENQLTNEMKAVNPSHFGFLDPTHTPESERTGITLHLGIAARKNGKNIETPVFNVSSGKTEHLTAPDFHHEMVVLPDQVKWEKGKPIPIAEHVKVKLPGGDIETRPFKDAKYVMPSAKGMFDFASNLIPFLPTNQGNRVSMADKQMEQAISLTHRESPLVQSKTDHHDESHTFEKHVGAFVSTRSPVNGKVVDVKHDAIVVSDGKEKHELHIYNHFPTNDPKGMLHSTPLVKPGDKVAAGQTIADSNFTRNGVLSVGTNLHVGYIPYKGYNFEDGIVISETAAKKLTSDHLHKKTMEIDAENDTISKEKWKAHAIVNAKSVDKEHLEALDENGIVKPGTKLVPGQIMIAAVGRNPASKAASALAAYGKRAFVPFRDKSMTWDGDHVGTVTKVVKSPNGKNVKVYVRTDEPAVVGDKLTGRHGNKGIISKILPDHEMPFVHGPDGEKKPLDILLNPSGVPTRINVGQMLETAASKIAEKTGKPYIVNNFAGPNHDYRQQVLDDLKKHGLSDEELVYDPNNVQKPLGSVMVGKQYILKLKHQVEKKLSVRGGGATTIEGKRLEYTPDRQPAKGTEAGGQGFGALDMYALLGHNARHNIREMSTYKSDMQDQTFWSMIQQGYEPPPPKAPFAYEKFTSLLKGLGVNVTKEGTSVRLHPMTSKEVLKMADNGRNEIKDATSIRSKDFKEEPGGLFDPKITGGKDGDKWSFIRLAEPLPNPVFIGHGNKPGPVPELLNMQRKDVEDVIQGKKPLNGLMGGKAIEEALKKVDVHKEIESLKKELPTLKGSALDRSNKKLKYLLALKDQNLKPEEAYMLHHVPVLPPKFRPPSVTPTGDISLPPVNGLYKNVFLVNQQLQGWDKKTYEESEKTNLRGALWDSMKALQAVGNYKAVYDADKSGNRELRGILDIVSRGGGEHGQPKEGFFQSRLIKRRQNLSIRSTIIPEPSLHIDEVALPRNAAMELYKPFVVAQLGKMMIPPLQAQEEMKKDSALARKALDHVIQDRPLLLKRDPVLHKFSVMAFKPVLTEGKAIKIHPMVTGGFNADFDGDTMAGTVPMSREAVEEAKKMFPSRNLFSPTSGRVMYAPAQEALLGLHLLSKWGKDSGKTFSNITDLEKSVESGKNHVTDVVRIKGMFGGKPTTLGRVLLESRLPRGFEKNQDVLHNSSFVLTKGSLNEHINEPIARHHTEHFAKTVDSLKDLGNEWSFKLGYSFGLKDLAPLKEREHILAAAHKEVAHAKKSISDPVKQERAVIEIYSQATKKMESAAKESLKDNRLAMMIHSGARGNPGQLQQMIAAPMLMQDSSNRTIPTPVTRSYSEGLDVGDYWLAQHGARKGTIQRSKGTSEPGAISKDIMNTTMSTLITAHDCGTKNGVLMSLAPKPDDPSYKDVHDRHLAAPYKLKDGTIVKEGTLLTPEVMNRLRNSKTEKVLVRSPLKCEQGSGICAKCYGLNENGHHHVEGTNIGVLAGQALGEPAVQMAMDAFHSGGVASSERGAKSVDRFTRLSNILTMPKTLKGEATLAMTSGTIQSVQKDPVGVNIHINGIRHFVPADRVAEHIKPGMKIERGERLSEGLVNPRTYLQATKDINAVQNHLTNEMYNGLYEKEGVRRRNIEVAVRALTNLTKIKDPGHSEFIHGDIVTRSVVESHNKTLPKGSKPIEHEPVMIGVEQIPTHLSDWMARLNYRELHQSIQEAASRNAKAELHGAHPIPAIAHGAEFGKPPPTKPKHVY